jgi:large subunit ribosomal protein L25
MGGMLEQALFTITIEALPRDIPTAIQHDVSALGMGDQLRVKDLAIPAGVTVQLDEEDLVAQVAVPRGAEEAAEEGEAAEGAEGGEGAPAEASSDSASE